MSAPAKAKLASATIAHGYVALVRSPESEALLADHKAFALLAYVAMRARYSSSTAGGLARGQMFMGRHSAARELGMTQGETREATKRLKTANHIGVRTTNKGSIVTLLSRTVFDITDGANNQQPPEITASQQPTNNQPTTTNEERIQEKRKTVCVGAEPPTSTHTPPFLSEVQAEFPDKDVPFIWQKMREAYATKNPERLTQTKLREWCQTEREKPKAKSANSSNSRSFSQRNDYSVLDRQDGPPGWRETLAKEYPDNAVVKEGRPWSAVPEIIRQQLFSGWSFDSKLGKWRAEKGLKLV